jgi:hypothetical protein
MAAPRLETVSTDISSPTESSLCFYDAAVKRQEDTITEDEYLQAIVAHCLGVRHGKNKLCNRDGLVGSRPDEFGRDPGLHDLDPFACHIADWIGCSVDADKIVHGIFDSWPLQLSTNNVDMHRYGSDLSNIESFPC